MELPFALNEAALRLSAFAGVLAAMALLESALPRRARTSAKSRRWATNLGIAGLGALIVRLMAGLGHVLAVPLIAVAAALAAKESSIGLFNATPLPLWLETVLAVLVLDWAIWLQHVASHKVPLLWRLHRVHHADVEIDVTTGVRFHPVEIALSMLYKVAVVFLLGAPAVAVVLFEVLLNATAMFNHANLKLPLGLDRILRLLVVTPDMHRIHHSVLRREHDTNYGFNLSIWDRLFATYSQEPQHGHIGMRIGLDEYPAPAPTRLWWSLKLPWKRASGE